MSVQSMDKLSVLDSSVYLIEIFGKKDQKRPNGTRVSVLTFTFNAKVDLDCLNFGCSISSCFSTPSFGNEVAKSTVVIK